jgi:hypothetical protein
VAAAVWTCSCGRGSRSGVSSIRSPASPDIVEGNTRFGVGLAVGLGGP